MACRFHAIDARLLNLTHWLIFHTGPHLLGSDPVRFFLLFGLGVGFLLCQALRLGLCGNQMSDAPCSERLLEPFSSTAT